MNNLLLLLIGFVVGAWFVASGVWYRQLRRFNPDMPRTVALALAICWPYCEARSDPEP